MTQIRDEFEPLLASVLENYPDIPSRLRDALCYSCLRGGKRIRPALVYASGKFCEIEITALNSIALAVELLHCFSLVHDDLPCMDNDDMRRGQPSTHKRFDEATGLLAGDALMSIAVEQLVRCSHLSAERKIRAFAEIFKAIGPSGMIGGQVLDMQYVDCVLDEPTLMDLHSRKTGALIRCCCTLPAMLMPKTVPNQAQRLECLHSIGVDLGVGFQIIDDILDEIAPKTSLGKQGQSDQSNGHYTTVNLYGVEGAKEMARVRRKNILTRLSASDGDARELVHLTTAVFDRALG